jgi:hypothetical protein
MGSSAVEHRKGRVNADLKVPALCASRILRVEAADAHHNLQQSADISEKSQL